MTARNTTPLMSRRGLLRLGAAAGLALSLAACGKRGPLEPPPDSPDATQKQPQGDQTAVMPGLKGAKKRPPPVKPPKGDFFLDFLL